MSEGKMECEIDRLNNAASTAMWSVYWTVVVKKELSWNVKFDLPASPRSLSHLWTWTLDAGWKDNFKMSFVEAPSYTPGESVWGRRSLGIAAYAAASTTWPWKCRRCRNNLSFEQQRKYDYKCFSSCSASSVQVVDCYMLYSLSLYSLCMQRLLE